MNDIKNSVTISETSDYESLVGFFVVNGLEFSGDEKASENIVKCWKAEDMEKHLAGGCVLAMHEGGEYICDGIATDPAYRAQGLGSLLIGHLVDEVRMRGGKRIFLVARAPMFFLKNGFIAVPREDAPGFHECSTCAQYNETCFPEVMRFDLSDVTSPSECI